MKLNIYIFLFLLICQSLLAQIGTLDTTFDVGSGPYPDVNTIAIQPDGKIIIGGSFISYDGVNINRLARLNSDGSIDNSFNIGLGPSGVVYKIKVLPNGKIFVAGNFEKYNNQDCDFIVKLNSDGSRDTSFTVVHNSSSSAAYDFQILPSGKILLAGILNDFTQTGLRTLVRLNADGSLDTSFNMGGTGFESTTNSTFPEIKSIDLQSDGKIIVGGFFYKYNGIISRFLARLNTDGSLDTTFQNGDTVYSGPSNEITSIKVLDDDKILIGGENATYNGDTVNYLMRLNSDGTLDTSFSVLNAYNNHHVGIVTPSQIELLNDNRIVVVGSRTTINGHTPRSIVVYNYDGSLDTAFNTGMGLGPNSKLNTCAIQSDGKILIGGIFQFTTYDTTPINRLARINNGTLGINDFESIVTDKTVLYPNPANQFLFISDENRFTEYAIFSQEGKLIETKKKNNLSKISISHLASGIYYLNLYQTNDVKKFKFIKTD